MASSNQSAISWQPIREKNVQPSKLSVGIVLTSNIRGGIAKLVAMMASDLASAGHDITLYVPVLPYYYYYATLRPKLLSWIKAMIPVAVNWARQRRFAFDDMLARNEDIGKIEVKFVTKRASKRMLKQHDWLILNGIADVIEYKNLFPQERQTYIVHNLPEYAHGHKEMFREVHRAFEGRTVAISPFVARELTSDVDTPPVVPNPISPGIWRHRRSIDVKASRRDLVLYWKNDQAGNEGTETIKQLRLLRPGTTVTVWFRAGIDTTKVGVKEALPDVQYAEDLGEAEVADLLLGHSLLLFPQSFEEFGMPPVEGLACGCLPVLRPNVGAAEMYARDGENSLHLSDSPEENARRISEVLDTPATLHSMRGAAPDSIDAFDPARYGHRILESSGVL